MTNDRLDLIKLLDDLKQLIMLEKSFSVDAKCLCCTLVMEQSEGKVLSEQFDVGSNVTEARYPEICRVVSFAVGDYLKEEIKKLKMELGKS